MTSHSVSLAQLDHTHTTYCNLSPAADVLVPTVISGHHHLTLLTIIIIIIIIIIIVIIIQFVRHHIMSVDGHYKGAYVTVDFVMAIAILAMLKNAD